ncbi:MAG TPA: glycerol-3-phosphate acyltransferase, partial [Deltaproteobacteria bacterium]|nr:glycerol-3-phosphate acyltransferase [Deltaproteobacteria bacterium]
IGDCLKGLLPVLLVKQLGFSFEYAALIGLAAFCGHVYTIFLGFKGGKGVATALGVFLAISPLAVSIALLVFVLMMVKWRYVSLGSISAAAVMPVAVALLDGRSVLIGVTLLIALIVIVKHHSNIRRLMAGTENRFKA